MAHPTILCVMSSSLPTLASLTGQSFRDREGQRWWISGPRAATSDQLIVQQELKGDYPRVAVHVMTEPEFRAHAQRAGLESDKPASRHRER